MFFLCFKWKDPKSNEGGRKKHMSIISDFFDNFLKIVAFLRPQKLWSSSMVAILNLRKTLKKSPALLHIVENVIVQFE